LTGATKVYLDEHRIRCKDGSWKWVVDRGVVRSRDTAGRAVRMIGTVRDINARKLTELKMAEEHSLLMAVIDAIPMRVFWKDKQFNYMGCNSEFALDAGKQSPAEVVGQDDFKMGWATQADLYRADDQQVMDSGVVKLFYDEPQTTPQGQVIWLRTSKIPLKDQSGKIFGVLGIYEDISQRKQAEELVRKLSQVADQSPESVVIASLDANIEYVNVAFERNTGYSRAEVIGQNSRILHSNLTPENTFVGMWQALTQGQTWNGELFNRRKDGTLYTEWAVISPLRDDAGVVTHYVAVKEDITEKNRLAAELDAHRHDLELLVEQRTTELTTARQQADASNRSKSDFLANMSHEIRTPMNGVIGMADVLAQTSLTPEQRRMLSTINSSSMALLSILNDILDFSKIEAGKLDIEQIATPLREVVEGAAQVMLSTASRKNVEISLFIDPSLPEWIICDPTRLRQILLNLLGNALKFVSLRSGHAMLHVQPCTRPDGSSCLHLSVIDNGIGMSPNIVAKLFQPFVQADASTVRRFGGTGLGLSITQRLVDLLHGSISVQSTPGVGSEFTVELPLQVAAAPEGIKTRSLPDLHGIHVLCVNPSTACLTLFQTYLGSVGAQVIALPDMVAAHSLLNQPLQNNVLLLNLTQAGGADVNAQEHQRLELDTRVVRLVRRRTSGMPAHVIEVQAGPLLYHDLLQGVALASQRISITDMVVGTPQANASQRVAPSVAAAIQAGQLILLAEDNETNRDVMGAQLHLLGYACEMAFDGERALSMWRNGLGSNDESGRYAMLLTDCHMPNLDGFELAKAIRQSEPEGSHLPIIAITANAMQGEAERCHDRGMDGYLCKPLRLQELGDILNKWLPLADLTPAGEPPQQLVEFTTSLAIWNPETLAEIVGNNPAVHQRLLKKFLLNADKQCKQITGAMKAADLTTLALLAHTLKSAARAVGALALGELCQNIETAGNAQDHAACSAWTSDLDDTLAAAAQRIRPHLGDDISLAIESMDS
jgi:PAS domain S-box-containing protein